MCFDNCPNVHWFASEPAGPLDQETGVSRLTVDVSGQQHQSLRAMTALEGKGIRQHVLERLFPADEEAADEEKAAQELRALLLERLAEAERGEGDQRSMVEIARDGSA